ncbi:MAG: hypothetical protein EOP39_08150 [Rubrivivax sp.]|nr:MAG: hypothetical protein EOP39_08150 [Rubrivivax sp.]
MAPVGLSVRFDGAQGAGIYPALLQEVGAAAGCEFRIYRVPSARLQKMFETARADVMVPASVAAQRDAHGEFIPLVQVRASLLAFAASKPVPSSLAELVAQPRFKLAVVRGFTYGAAYDRTLATLRAQRRLVEEPDAAGVARALRRGLAHASVMTAHLFVGTLALEADLAPLIAHLQVQPLKELDWAESGIYLSHRLPEADRHALRQALRQAVRSGRIWRLFNEGYPPGSLVASMRPLAP